VRFVICYDITDDRRRARVAAALLDYGARLQESVFVATLDDELEERLVARLRKLIDPLADKVHLFAQCGACAAKVVQLGEGEIPQDQPFYVV
jgi:CRISPR-associated protein Cas2